MPQFPSDRTAFFLGGADLEMVAIRSLLLSHVPLQNLFDKSLSWGARASDYRAEIEQARARGWRLVCIELANDLPELAGADILWIDHHGLRAGVDVPSSLEQLFHLLQCPASEWTRDFQLIAANDRGSVAALQALGASSAEIVQVRAADRRAQGITAEQEESGRLAASHFRSLCNGRLTLVTLDHDRTATVTDVLHSALGGPGYENLLVVSPHETNFFGNGAAINALQQVNPDSWTGGELPQRGFWGCCGHPPVLKMLAEMC